MKTIRVDKLFIKLESSAKSFFGLLGRNKLKVFLALVGVLALSGVIYAASGGSFSVGSANIPAGSIANPSGLIGYWKLDEESGTFADGSGNGNTLTQAGGVTYAQPGKINKAVGFDGTDDVLDGNNSIVFDTTSDFTLSAWVNWENGANSNEMIVCQWDYQVSSPYALYIAGTKPTLKLGDGTSYTNYLANSDIPTNRWTHILATADLPNRVYNIYINGVLDKTAAIGASIDMSEGLAVPILRIGKMSSGDRFKGSIDDVRIYTRALSAIEVSRLYNTGQSKVNSSQNLQLTDGLVGLWSFSDSDINGTSALDRSGLGNNGTISGATKTLGKVGQAMSFDGVGDNVYFADISAVELADTSFSFWGKVNSLDRDHDFFTKGTHSSSQPLLIWFDDVVSASAIIGDGNTNTISVVVYDGSTIHWLAAPTNSINDTDWHHISVIVEPTTRLLELYIDGVLAVSNTMTWNGIQDTATGIRLGNTNPVSATTALNGSMDDVRIYDRALSSAEIQRLYKMGDNKINSTKNLQLTDGLVGLWSFADSDISGTTVLDRSGSENNGTINGATKSIGKVGQGMSFDGVNDWIFLPAGASPIPPNGPLTMAVWFKTGSTSKMNIFGELSHWTDAYGLGLLIYFHRVHALSAANNLGWYDNLMSEVLTANTWHHAVFTLDSFGANTNGILYIDGAEVSSYTGTASRWTNYYTGIGGAGGDENLVQDPNARFFNGSIDEARIYNRPLSASEVTRLYNMGR